MAGSGIQESEKQKDGKRWLMLLLSFFLAFAIWLLHSLSLNYSVFLEYSVKLDSSLEGRSGTSVSDDILIVRGRAEGYYILRQRIGKAKQINLTVPPSVLHLKDSVRNIFSAGCEDLKSEIVAALGTSVSLEFTVTDSMDFVFTRISSKKVPVSISTSITYDDQYIRTGDIRVEPDSIEIFGEDKLISAIDSVITKTISYSRVNTPVQGITELMPIRRIRFSEKTIFYAFNVERYVEESMYVKVTPRNVPAGKGMIVIPSMVKLTYKRLYDGGKYFDQDFSFSVSYKDLLKTIDSKLVPVPELLPAGVISYETDPPYVDCVLFEDNI